MQSKTRTSRILNSFVLNTQQHAPFAKPNSQICCFRFLSQADDWESQLEACDTDKICDPSDVGSIELELN